MGISLKAILLSGFGGVEDFRLQEVSLPVLEEGYALVRIKATSFNPFDYPMRQGLGERKLLHSPILGREFARIIQELGSFNPDFKLPNHTLPAQGSLFGAY